MKFSWKKNYDEKRIFIRKQRDFLKKEGRMVDEKMKENKMKKNKVEESKVEESKIEKSKMQESKIQEIMKMVFVAMIVFFGTAFAIMSFNEDVGVGDLFEKIYLIITGTEHSGLGVLEMAYGIGMALGITMFYNRLTNKKNRQNEPTPIEIKMKQYEDDINDYIEYQSQNMSNMGR